MRERTRLLKVLFISFICCFIFLNQAEAEVFKVPLYKLAPAKTVNLKCVSAGYSIKIPIPDRWKVEKAILTFSYVNSTGLLADKSRMTIKVNDYPVSQINLNPLAPEGFVKLSLPALLLESGYNDLSFNVSQHYSLECEQPCAEDLWTTLKLDQAALEIEYSLKEVPLKLASIASFLFDSRISPEGRVNIVMPDYNVETVSIASIAASGVARRFDYRNVIFSVSDSIRPGYDNIVIGNGDAVQGILKAGGLSALEIKGPFLKIMHMPGAEKKSDPQHALILISGMNADHVKLAAETFAIMSTSFPDTEEMIAMEFIMPEISMYGGRLIVSHDKKYAFKNLNFPSHTFKGINPSPQEIVFRLPADFLIRPNLYADLSLHFVYGAALRADSALNISLNGKLIRAIHLNDAKGALIEGYKLNIPTHIFRPGTNILRFEPVLTPFIGKNCENIQTENLFLTLFDNSMLYFPPMPHFVDLPKIELFMLNGFPVTRWPDAHESMIYLASRDADTISAALNLIGVITQKNGYPLLEMKYSFKPPQNFKGELIIIGDIAAIPDDIKRIAPLNLTKQTTVPYPVIRSWNDETSLAFSKQVSGLSPGRGAVMEFQSPYAEGRTAVLLTATSTKELLDLTYAIMEPAVQAKCEGDLVLIDLKPPDYNVVSMNIGRKYFAGKAGKVSKIDMYLYTYPWLYYAALALVIIVLSLLFFYLLKKHRERRVKGETAGSSDN
jgi:hypothetical protein